MGSLESPGARGSAPNPTISFPSHSPSSPSRQKPIVNWTSLAGTVPVFRSLKLRLGTSLFKPSLTPASYQPVNVSTTVSVERSIEGPHPAAAVTSTESPSRPRTPRRMCGDDSSSETRYVDARLGLVSCDAVLTQVDQIAAAHLDDQLARRPPQQRRRHSRVDPAREDQQGIGRQEGQHAGVAENGVD